MESGTNNEGPSSKKNFALISFIIFLIQVTILLLLFPMPWAMVIVSISYLILPILLPLIGIYFAFKSCKRNESGQLLRWIGGIGNSLLLLGQFLLFI